MALLAARPAGSIATTDPAAAAAADGVLWRSLSGPHHALVRPQPLLKALLLVCPFSCYHLWRGLALASRAVLHASVSTALVLVDLL